MSYETLLKDSDYFCNKAEEQSDSSSQASVRFSTASIIFSFMAVELFINNMMSDFASLPKSIFTVYERGFLSERAVSFSTSGVHAGTFEITTRQEYKRLEDKILFLIARFNGGTIDKGDTLWQRFGKAKEIRDHLTHPRKDSEVLPTSVDARNALEVAQDIIRLVSSKVWGKSVEL